MLGHSPETPYDLRFSLFGIPVRVHPIFWVTSAILAYSFDRDPRVIVIGVGCIFVSILVHEFGHALVTRLFGWYPEIVLQFFGGYATTGRHSTWKNVAVTAAGPAAGFLLFFAVWAAALYFHRADWMQHELVQAAVGISLFINLIWNVFNLLPVIPLDGGQICRELLCWVSPLHGLRTSIVISIIVSGGIALWSLRQSSSGGDLLGLDPTFAAIIMGLLCVQNVQAYRALHSRYR